MLFAASCVISAEREKFAINHGPYLQNVGENSATIVWTTSDNAVSWVEISPDDGSHFYANERPKYFDSPTGKKLTGKLHRITVDNLEAGKTYNYRIFSKQVLDVGANNNVLYGTVASSRVYKAEPFKFTTLDPSKKVLKFCAVNDIHQDSDLLKRLLSKADKDCDFIILNGDMVNSSESEEQLFSSFLDETVKSTNSSKSVYFARGNHESRGKFSERFTDFLPTPTGKPYFYIKSGPAILIFLDCGEDKPDSDIEYSDTADFDNYRKKQAAWLKTVVVSDDFKNAKARIVIAHIPPAWGEWHGSIHFKKLFAPILNGKGISVILSGHLHKYVLFAPQPDGFDAPNVSNSNSELVLATVDEETVRLDFTDADGKKAREGLTFKTR